ncbi:hypothetical protein HY995_03585, partial [Candidatus Micrarchaeota archaeon]|nr:hypothetical protein [Candidatus Micrarchaeota archaeon]
DTQPPQWSSNSTSSVCTGSASTLSSFWTDNIQLSSYVLSFDNGSGAWVNDSSVAVGGAAAWVNVTKGLNNTPASTIRWRVYANDISGNMNATPVQQFDSRDCELPKFFDAQANSTCVGEAVNLSARWTDNNRLYGFIMSYDNGNGTFVNDSAVGLSGVQDWSNATKVITGPVGSTVRWQVFGQDYWNNWNNTPVYSFAARDCYAPGWFDYSSNNTCVGNLTSFTARWSHNLALSNYTFSFDNGTGTFANDSAVQFSGISNFSNSTKYINQTIGAAIRWRYFASDAYGNSNATPVASFQTVDCRIPDVQPPQWSNNQTTGTQCGGSQSVFSSFWQDNVQLSGYVLQYDSGNGVFANDSFVPLNAQNAWVNITKQLNSTSNSLVRWRVFANDTSNNWNATGINSFYTRDCEPPKWFENYTSAICAGQPATLGMRWTDNYALYGRIFSFDNGSGIFVNDSAASMAGVQDWSNATKALNATVGANIRWRVYAQDAYDNWNSTPVMSFQTVSCGGGGDTQPPTYSNNQTTGTCSGSTSVLSSYWTDNVQLYGYILSFDNGSGMFSNDSIVPLGAPTAWVNISRGINTTPGTTIRWRVFANDTSNNWNATGINSISTRDCEAGKWFANSTNSTCFNTAARLSLGWTDNYALYGYIFSYDEGNGAFVNDSPALLSGTLNWTNSTRLLSSPAGSRVRWKVYTQDFWSNWNATPVFSFTISDCAAPHWSGASSNNTCTGNLTSFSMLWADDNALANSVFSFDNGSGTFSDDPAQTMAGTQDWSNATKFINQTPGSAIRWRVRAYDASGNFNLSSTSAFNAVDCRIPDTSAPAYSNLQQSTMCSSSTSLLSSLWSDNVEIAGFIFSFDNGTGSFANDSWAPVGLQSAWLNVSKLLNNSVSSAIRWRVYANDTSGNWNATPIQQFTSRDCSAPQWFDNFTNSSCAGQAATLGARWADNYALYSFIFSWDNGTGAFTNNSAVAMAGTQDWSNFTLLLNPAAGSTIRWRAFARDSANNWAATPLSTFQTVNCAVPDTTPPAYSNNQTTGMCSGSAAILSSFWTDNVQLSSYILSFDNGSGTFANDSLASIGGQGAWVNVTKALNTTVLSTIRWRVFTSDASNNWNATPVQQFSTLDCESPKWLSQSRNNSCSGVPTKFSTLWTDNNRLYGYIFSIDNGNGTFANESAAGLNGVADWANATELLNATPGATVRWQVYAQDFWNNWNASPVSSFQLTDCQAPKFGMNASSSACAATYTTFRLPWTDNGGLASYVAQFDNGTGSFVSDPPMAFGGAVNWSNFTKLASTTPGAVIRWRVSATDASANSNTSNTYSYSTLDCRADNNPPLYYFPSWSSTIAGLPSSHNLFWTDDYSLSGFIFSFDNGTGIFVNDSWRQFDSFNNSWSNITKTLPPVVGVTVRWIVYANDSNNNWNASPAYAYLTTDEPPKYFENGVNSTVAGKPASFFVRWTDNIALNGSIFSFDNGNGVFANDSFAPFGGRWNYTNATKILNPKVGAIIRWRVWANDSGNLGNFTQIYSFTTAADSGVPSLISMGVNSTCTGEAVSFSTLWSDPNGFGFFIFSVDEGDGFANYSPTHAPGHTLVAAELVKRITDQEGSAVSWRVYATNAVGRSNATPVQTFTTASCAGRGYGPAGGISGGGGAGNSIPAGLEGIDDRTLLGPEVYRLHLACPYAVVNASGEFTATHIAAGRFSCSGVTLSAARTDGLQVDPGAIADSGCVGTRPKFVVTFPASGDYIITASSSARPGLSTSCIVNYQAIRLTP